MTLDAYVKKDTCDGGYFQGDETFYVFDVDVDAASSLQEFGEKKHEVLGMTLKTTTRTTTTKKTSTTGH